MKDANLVDMEAMTQKQGIDDRFEETIANMDETDWMAMLMEMRVISA